MKPVVVDASLNRAFTVKYAIYTAAGIAAVFAVPPALQEQSPPLWQAIWVLGLASSSAFAFAFSLKEKWQRREMVAVIFMLGFLASYTISLAAALFTSEHPATRLVVTIFTLSFLVFPSWRAGFLYRKLRGR